MNIDPTKVIEAIAALKGASEALMFPVESLNSGVAQQKAVECLAAAAALQASVQISGLTHRTFHSTGSIQ